MQTLVLVLLLAGVLGLLTRRVHEALQNLLNRRPALVWGAPLLLTGVFAAAAAMAGAASIELIGLVLVYTIAPVLCVWLGRREAGEKPGTAEPSVGRQAASGRPARSNDSATRSSCVTGEPLAGMHGAYGAPAGGKGPATGQAGIPGETFAGRRGASGRPAAADFLAVALLWLPLEFAAGGSLVPRAAQGFLHSVAYGIAILLGLILFLGFRQLKGMKYQLPRTRRDLWLPLAGFALTAPVLVAIGIPIGFIPPPHLPAASGTRMATAVGLIFAGTAIPEEILFRSLIQNLMMQRWGTGFRVLLAASFIFGCAHLDNGPQPAPNWRYMILATVAGIAYGKVFEKSGTVVSSAVLHTLVDWTKHFFF
jgi:membrane protease YdiL (CAAX protease family)